jgi:hypothetical protein
MQSGVNLSLKLRKNLQQLNKKQLKLVVNAAVNAYIQHRPDVGKQFLSDERLRSIATRLLMEAGSAILGLV